MYRLTVTHPKRPTVSSDFTTEAAARECMDDEFMLPLERVELTRISTGALIATRG